MVYLLDRLACLGARTVVLFTPPGPFFPGVDAVFYNVSVLLSLRHAVKAGVRLYSVLRAASLTKTGVRFTTAVCKSISDVKRDATCHVVVSRVT